MFYRIEESVSRPKEDVFEARSGDYGCYAGVAEEVPGCGDEGGVVVEFEAGVDI